MDTLAKQQLEKDYLTGLPTRAAFELALECQAEMAAAETPDESPLVVSFALSRFGNVSSSLGSVLGDKVLSTVAKRLAKLFPNALCIGRTHGD